MVTFRQEHNGLPSLEFQTRMHLSCQPRKLSRRRGIGSIQFNLCRQEFQHREFSKRGSTHGARFQQTE